MKKIKFEDFRSLSKKDFGGIIKVIPTQLLENLESSELPIKNKEIAIKNICNFLMYLNTEYSKTQNSLIVISQEIFIKYFSRDTYIAFKEILKSNQILTQVSYENGIGYSKDEGIAMQYRIHTNYLTENDYTILIFKSKNNKDVKIVTDVEVPKNMFNTILNEELDYQQVFEKEYAYYKEYNTSKFSLFIRISRALQLNTERRITKGNKVDRIYHSFSNLSKITRGCFYTKFNNIDIVNTQPLLLVYLLKENNLNFENQYQIECENGTFYELFYDLYNIKDENELRIKVKTMLYKSIYFNFNETAIVNKRFKELFPNTWQTVKELTDLASKLQNIEARLFNNIEVKYSSKYYTLFDAIYFNDKRDIKNIIKQIEDFGNKINLKISFKIEEK